MEVWGLAQLNAPNEGPSKAFSARLQGLAVARLTRRRAVGGAIVATKVSTRRLGAHRLTLAGLSAWYAASHAGRNLLLPAAARGAFSARNRLVSLGCFDISRRSSLGAQLWTRTVEEGRPPTLGIGGRICTWPLRLIYRWSGQDVYIYSAWGTTLCALRVAPSGHRERGFPYVSRSERRGDGFTNPTRSVRRGVVSSMRCEGGRRRTTRRSKSSIARRSSRRAVGHGRRLYRTAIMARCCRGVRF